jgi:predicted TIM-barrel fold metal-dependent hydrolase
VPAFEAGSSTLEVDLDPYSFATLNIAPAHFLLTMVLGGVFERHPNLRFGAIECGAGWLAPLAENLDLWAERSPMLRHDLSLTPTEYIARNVRVTPFHFEPVHKYIERYGMDTCYCFSTDYPHIEGGNRPAIEFAERLISLGDDLVEQFFVSNGRLLLPD